MPVDEGIGHGFYTSQKIEHFSDIVGMHLKVTGAVLEKHPYYRQQYRFIDMTAGKGHVPGTDIPGSPLAFLQRLATEQFRKKCRADFIEENVGHLTELKNHLSAAGFGVQSIPCQVYCHNGRYQDMVPNLFPCLDSKEFGLAFVDPSGNLPDFDTLSFISRMRPKIDLLIYVSTTNIKRVYGQTGMLLSDYMQHVGKEYWLIRKPTRDSHKWIFLLGSSGDIFKKYRRIGLLRLDSEEAQDLFPMLNLSAKQRMEQIQPRLRFE